MKSMNAKLLAGHYLQAMMHGRGNPQLALSFAQGQGQWADLTPVCAAIKLATGGYTTADGVPGVQGGALRDAVLEALRDAGSVALRLQNLRRTPMFTRVFMNAAGVVATTPGEGSGAPVLKGDWSGVQLTPKLHTGIIVTTDEIAKSTSPEALAGLIGDLAAAVVAAEDRAMIDPTVSGSILNGASNFVGTGTAVANTDADLRALVDAVNGADHPGAAFLMTKRSATYLSLLRGTGGGAAYPNISPQGGTLIGLPVFITSAVGQPGSPASSFVGLVNPSEVFFADGGVALTASKNATLEMNETPTASSATATGSTTNLVSMFQANATAAKMVRESSWVARSGSAAYFVAGY